jgi:hypothetical protein
MDRSITCRKMRNSFCSPISTTSRLCSRTTTWRSDKKWPSGFCLRSPGTGWPQWRSRLIWTAVCRRLNSLGLLRLRQRRTPLSDRINLWRGALLPVWVDSEPSRGIVVPLRCRSEFSTSAGLEFPPPPSQSSTIFNTDFVTSSHGDVNTECAGVPVG